MEEHTNAFSLLHDVAVPSDPVLVQWCPTMDVCAVAAQDGQLRLHRMNWQLLWSVVPEADVTSLCWHPSGKKLAAGLKNGMLLLVDVETGHMQARHKAHFAAIAHICWAECVHSPEAGSSQTADGASNSSSSAAVPSYTRFFHPPDPAAVQNVSPTPIPGPYSSSVPQPSSLPWPTDTSALDLLAVADSRGNITLWAQGQLQVAEVSLAALFPDIATNSMRGVMLSSALDQLLVLHGSGDGAVHLSSCSIQLLWQHRAMLHHCSVRLGLLAQLVADALTGLTSAAKDWAQHMEESRKRLKEQLLQDLLDQGSSLTDASAEFMLLLVAGGVTPAMHHYLSSSLGEAGLRRLARGIDTAAGRLHTFLLDQLLPRLRVAAYLLAELRGTAACPGAALPDLHLPASLFRQLELLTVQLLLRGEQLRLGLIQVAGQHRAFFGWLLGVLRGLEAAGADAGAAGARAAAPGAGEVGSLERLQDITAFLRGQFQQDLVGQQLQAAELGAEAQAAAQRFLFPEASAAAADQLMALVFPTDTGCTSDQDQLPAALRELSGKGAAVAAAAAAAAGGGGAPKGPLSCRVSTPLLALLQELSSQCAEALEQPCAAISPSIQGLGSWLLCQAGQESSSAGGEATGSSMGSSGAGSGQGSSAVKVAAGAPISQPVQQQDRSCRVCCLEARGGASQLLLVRSAAGDGNGDSSLQQQQEEGRAGAWQCCRVQLPVGVQVLDVAWYKQEQLALLVQKQQAAGDGSGSSSSSGCQLWLLDTTEAPWRAASQVLAAGALAMDAATGAGMLASSCEAVVELQQLPVRCRELPAAAGGQAPLGVSRTRGLALVVSDMQHVCVLDLEEDDEDGEADEADEEGRDMEE